MATTPSFMPGNLMTGSVQVGTGGKKLSPQQKMNQAAQMKPAPISYTKPGQPVAKVQARPLPPKPKGPKGF